MKLTNKLKLPHPLVKAVAKAIERPHNAPGEYSVTTLQSGVREILLTARHYNEIETDVSDEIWSVFGTAVHSLLEAEAVGEEGIMAEVPLRLETPYGTLTGKSDLIIPPTATEESMIEDYKTCKTFAIIYPETPKKWREQILRYCAILNEQGKKVRRGRVIAFLKDWSPSEAIRVGKNYPSKPVVVFRWMYSEQEIKDALKRMVDKIKIIKSVENTPDDELPLCSDEERWAEPITYAVKRDGGLKATKVFKTIEEAEEFLKVPRYSVGYEIQQRGGLGVKCKGFCKARDFCSQWKEASENDNS